MTPEYAILFQNIIKVTQIKVTQKKETFITDDEDKDHLCSENTIEDGYKTICTYCGQIYNEYYISSFPIAHGHKRRQRIDTIYDILPAYFSQNIKDVTIEIYRYVTQNRIFRNSHKKSIMAACFHRACNLSNYDISYNDLMEIFSIKQNEMNKGFTKLTTCLPRDSIYNVPFDTDKDERLIILSLLKNTGMEAFAKPTIELFKMVKTKTNLMNESFCKSVVCGCIYFWIKYRNIPKTSKEVSQKFNMSAMTVLNKYIVIYGMVLRVVMKNFFCSLLKHCIIRPHAIKYKNILLNKPEHTLYNPETKVLITNAFEPEKIKAVRLSSNKELPLDDVNDIKDWNMLLDQKFYNSKGLSYVNVVLNKNTRDYTFNYNKYNDYNNMDAKTLLHEEIFKLFNN